MPDSPRSPRLRDHLDPTLISQVRRVSWVWFGAFVAAGAVTTASVAQLKAPVWFVIAGGRFTDPGLVAMAPWALVLIGWGFALALAIAIMASGEWARPDRAWPMVVVIVVAAVGAPFIAALVTGAILQLGHPVLATADAARLLDGTADLVSRIALAAALVSLVAVPGVLATRRESRRRRDQRVRPS